jgi:hypothetical protein
MSDFPPKADIARRHCHVRLVPLADIGPRLLDHLVGACEKRFGNRQA